MCRGRTDSTGHHHVGHIGILGADKKGREFYQITPGGSADGNASIGRILGPGFSGDEIGDAIETVVDTYLTIRDDGEAFIDTYADSEPTPSGRPSMPLPKHGDFIEDEWLPLGGDDALPEGADVIVGFDPPGTRVRTPQGA